MIALADYEKGLAVYLRRVVPGQWRRAPGTITTGDLLAFERTLYRTEWFGVWLPASVGGQGLGRRYQISFERELARAGVPDRVARVGQNLLLPTLLNFGTPSQVDAFAAPTISGTLLWCQGFSETEAGSDLAALRTQAKKVPGGFVVRGQKVWTSLAHLADFCFALVRTQPGTRKHGGISMLLIDMRSPGVEHRPIRQIDGRSEFAEVFFDDVFVPDDRILGPEGSGWSVAMATLQYERSSANFARQVRLTAELGWIARMLGRADLPGGLGELYLHRLGAAIAKARILELAAERIAWQESNEVPVGTLGAMTKLYWSEAHQEAAAFGAEVAHNVSYRDPATVADDQRYWDALYFSSRAETIYAGTSQIQRNIIARRGLGLPRGDGPAQ